MKLVCRDKVLDLSRPQVMGILNITPDSFSDAGKFLQLDQALTHAAAMVTAGAAIIDIGGESTRPGALPITPQQELDRVAPVVTALRRELDVIISVDTSSPEVMQEAIRLGANLINDTRALQREGALNAAAQLKIPVCLMHMHGEPSNMQYSPSYNDVVQEVLSFLQQRVDTCQQAGIAKNQLLIDPGFGFGKLLAHNLQLLNRLQQLQCLELPIMVGLSRKSMIGQILNQDVNHRLVGGLAAAVLAVSKGACIIRTHDVQPTVDAIKMAWTIMQEKS